MGLQAEVAESLRLAAEHFDGTYIYGHLSRFFLETYHRVLFRQFPLVHPVLEIGVSEGISSAFINHGRGLIDWAGDMPLESTFESNGLYLAPPIDHVADFVGMDVSNIPFADDSFATILLSEVLGYGMDLDRSLSEICRVLAPGGRCVMSITTPEIGSYPSVMAALRRDVPSIVLPPAATFLDMLRRIDGAERIQQRSFFSSDLHAALLTLSAHMKSAPGSPSFRVGLITDGELRRWYAGLLTELSEIIVKDLSGSHTGQGAHALITFTKRGALSEPKPRLRCVACGSDAVEPGFLQHACRDCGATYPCRLGVPMMLRGRDTAYSPKPDASHQAWAADQAIWQAVQSLDAAPRAIVGTGFRETALFRALLAQGIETVAFVDPSGALVGATKHQLPIVRQAEGARAVRLDAGGRVVEG